MIPSCVGSSPATPANRVKISNRNLVACNNHEEVTDVGACDKRGGTRFDVLPQEEKERGLTAETV